MSAAGKLARYGRPFSVDKLAIPVGSSYFYASSGPVNEQC